MTCRCATNTLRLFVRSIAQVDLNAASAHRAPRISNTSIPNFTQKRVQPQWTSQRAFSSTSAPLKDDNSPTRHATSESQSGWQQERNVAGSQVPGDSESAFVEFSLDAIDAIAAEAQPPRNKIAEETVEEYETPLQILLKDAPKRKEKTPKDPLSRTTIRRTKVANTSFALHYSSPRAPPSSQASTKERPRGSEKPRSEDVWTPEQREQQREHWQKDKSSLEKKFPDGWKPLKKLSPDAISGIRVLHAQFPERYTTEALAAEFEISPEAIRRILKSKWAPNSEEESDRQRRWFKRGEIVWSRWAEMGKKPPKQWRDLGIGNGKPEWMKRKKQGPKPLPPLITHARRRDAKYGVGAVLRTRSKDEPDSLADRIL
jgi:hypothetical protein